MRSEEVKAEEIHELAIKEAKEQLEGNESESEESMEIELVSENGSENQEEVKGDIAEIVISDIHHVDNITSINESKVIELDQI